MTFLCWSHLSHTQFSHLEHLICCLLQEKYPSQLSNARGVGVFCAVDVKDQQHRDKLVGALKEKGTFLYFYIFQFCGTNPFDFWRRGWAMSVSTTPFSFVFSFIFCFNIHYIYRAAICQESECKNFYLLNKTGSANKQKQIQHCEPF